MGYYLVGNLDGDDDLWLISTTEKVGYPVPKSIWEDVVAMFQAEALSAEPADHEARKDAAANILAAIEAGTSVSRNVKLALSAGSIGSVLVTMRSSPVDMELAQQSELAAFLGKFVSEDG